MPKETMLMKNLMILALKPILPGGSKPAGYAQQAFLCDLEGCIIFWQEKRNENFYSMQL